MSDYCRAQHHDVERAASYPDDGFAGPQCAEGQSSELLAAQSAALMARMESLAQVGVRDAMAGREAHATHLRNRGSVGLVSDFWQDLIPPHVGAWDHALHALARSQVTLARGSLPQARTELIRALTALEHAQSAWAAYLGATIAGAERTADGLRSVRDGAVAMEIALLSGGMAGGGALGLTVGAGAGIGAGAMLPSSRDAVRGTFAEIAGAGVVENLRYAAWGICGLGRGLGAGLEAAVGGFVMLFTDPLQLVEDLAQLPAAVSALYQGREQLWAAFSRLPPQAQAHAVGQLAGHVEALLVSVEATRMWAQALRGLGLEMPPPMLPATAGAGSLDAAVVQLVDFGGWLGKANALSHAQAMSSLADDAASAKKKGNGDEPELFENTLPERLEGEMELAAELGAVPIRADHPDLAKIIGNEEIKFVVLENGEVLLMRKIVDGQEISHSVLARGRPVISAGEAQMYVQGGRVGLFGLEHHSGHYLPSKESLKFAREAFKKAGVECLD